MWPDEINGFCQPCIISLFIVLFFSITIFYVLPWLSEQISSIGVYHRYDPKDENQRGKKIMKAYFCVSIPLMASYILILNSLNVIFDGFIAFTVVATAMGTLLVIRIRGNPSDCTILFKKLFPDDKRSEIIEQHRERILSFIFSLIAAQVIIALLAFGYGAYFNLESNLNFEYPLLLTFAVIYIIGLFITCWYGERYLKNNPPVNTIKYLK